MVSEMASEPPDYTALEPPVDTSPDEYDTHERRAEILDLLVEAGNPFDIKQVRLADRYDVHESTISRDMDRLRESVDEHLGTDAKFTTRTLYQNLVKDLLAEDDWKAKAKAWDIQMDWNRWLADLGEQHREPKKSEIDMRSAHVDVAYRVVREGDAEEVLEDANPADLGFTEAPAELPAGDGDV